MSEQECKASLDGHQCELESEHGGKHQMVDDGFLVRWIAEPAEATLAVPQAPDSRADRLNRYLLNPNDHLLDKSPYGDLVMFTEAAAAIRVLEGKLRGALEGEEAGSEL